MTETLKIGRACFIGGVLCCAVAFLVAPKLFWLGIPAGLAGGYVAYQFRDVLLAIPRAFAAALSVVRGMSGFFVEVGRYAWMDICEQAEDIWSWLKDPHPFFYPAFALWTTLFTLVYVLQIPFQWEKSSAEMSIMGAITLVFIVGPILFGVIFAIPSVILGLLLWGSAALGARYTENSLWHGEWFIPGEFMRNGIQKAPMTYANAYRWIGKLLVFLLKKLVVSGPSALGGFLRDCAIAVAYGVYRAAVFMPAFLYELVRLVHCNQRVLCSIDGTLGGLAALAGFYFYGNLDPTPVDYLMTAIFGGFIGAALGVANWELISKRYFGFNVSSM